jgi:L-fuconolactonase
MRIDAHQHFWEYDPEDYPWITEELGVLRRSFLPPHLMPELVKSDLDGSIAVQARQTLEESRWLLRLSEQNPGILGVVGWVDLCSDQVEEQLQEFAKHPQFVGVRHVLQDEPDDNFMLRSDFQHGISKLKEFGLTYDILVFPKQLSAAIELVRKFPDQPFVIDHIAKPQIRDKTIAPWDDHMRQLASFSNVCCKVSGMVTEADWKEWQAKDMKPYLDVVFDAFGPDRLMFGTDWPVCQLAGEYQSVFDVVHSYMSSLSDAERAAVMGGTAAKFYGVAKRP